MIFGKSSFDNKVQGNFIGTKSGSDAKPNRFARVRLMKGAVNNTIGGTNVGEGNVISGNGHWGIQVAGEPQIGDITVPTNNHIQGNLIGLKASGLSEITAPNTIAGNIGPGVWVKGNANAFV